MNEWMNDSQEQGQGQSTFIINAIDVCAKCDDRAICAARGTEVRASRVDGPDSNLSTFHE
jgi:hypothetical protein